jgi:hypothetical protein
MNQYRKIQREKFFHQKTANSHLKAVETINGVLKEIKRRHFSKDRAIRKEIKRIQVKMEDKIKSIPHEKLLASLGKIIDILSFKD